VLFLSAFPAGAVAASRIVDDRKIKFLDEFQHIINETLEHP
jgi:hypothetical protein